MAQHGKNSSYSTDTGVSWKVVDAEGVILSDEYGTLTDLTADEAEDSAEAIRERGRYAQAVRDLF